MENITKVAVDDIEYLLKGSGAMVERAVDVTMTEAMGRLMALNLKGTSDRGRNGWWDENICDIHDLEYVLERCLAKGDMVGVACVAGMIHMRKNMPYE